MTPDAWGVAIGLSYVFGMFASIPILWSYSIATKNVDIDDPVIVTVFALFWVICLPILLLYVLFRRLYKSNHSPFPTKENKQSEPTMICHVCRKRLVEGDLARYK